MTAIWLRLELRRRRRSLVVLALLVALATTTVLAAVAGARRGATSMDRLLAETLPGDAVVLPNQPGFDWDRVRALPTVEAVATFALSGFYIEGIPGGSVTDWLPAIADDQSWYSIEKPLVLQGRLPGVDRADELAASPRFLQRWGLEVGDTVTVLMPGPQQSDDPMQNPATVRPAGPRFPAVITGVVRSPWFSDQVGGEGFVLGSYGMFAKYRANIMGSEESVNVNALVRLHDGTDGIPAFKRELARATGRNDIDVWDMDRELEHVDQVLGFEALSLLAFALAALAAAMILIGQSIARYCAAAVAELRVLRAAGLTPRQAVTTAATAPVIAAAAGAGLGLAGAFAASNWMPIGMAALGEPHPGPDADWPVLASGWLVVVALAVLAAVGSAWIALRGSRPAARPSAVASAATRAGLPVPVVVGARFALERGHGAVPVRPALLGAVVGVLGVLAALTFSAGVSDAGRNPARYGQTHQVNAYLGFGGRGVDADRVLPRIAGDRDVVGVNDGRSAVAQSGRTAVGMYSYAPVGRSIRTVLTEGRMPAADHEVLLAVSTARLLGAEVGGTVPLTGQDGRARVFTVTGIGFVPIGSHNDYDEGAYVTARAWEGLFDTFKFHMAQVALRPGADPEAVTARFRAEAARLGLPIAFEAVRPPKELAEAREMEVLPVLLAGFLTSLAVGAVGHALATAVRRRRRELAVMRALGLTRRQARRIVVVQATLIALTGLIFGVPLGLALGRTLWRTVADNAPLFYQPPVAFWALLLVGPAAIATANLLAAWPGRTAARLRVGDVLRTE
ncbi:ABC transporter permease [Planobispora takensis]|uniref:ABC3 transporter permease C-terminal domain-containing protein n=1 Tax=Planobispora takensis TaxID=1367882 RepID=A0A8J3SX15_9ACTN|nr:FtsX-like permease family protein [Planobispora takensis]GII00361.1 hypothetical protein Pta02_23690 [Planobispora takensis]